MSGRIVVMGSGELAPGLVATHRSGLVAAGALLFWAQDAHRRDLAPYRMNGAEAARAWITDRRSSFFPLDAAAAGIDMESLVVARLPGVRDVPRAADRLARLQLEARDPIAELDRELEPGVGAGCLWPARRRLARLSRERSDAVAAERNGS